MSVQQMDKTQKRKRGTEQVQDIEKTTKWRK